MLFKLLRSSKFWIGTIFVFLFLTIGGAGYVWHFLNRPFPPEIEVAENALFDGTLVGIGLVDVEKSIFLERYWFGDFDPKALPMNDMQQGLMEKLFSGPAHFKENLRHLLVSLHVNPEDKSASIVMLASGRFDEKALVTAVEEYYKLEKVESGRWKIVGDRKLKSESPCDKNVPVPEGSETFIQVSPEWVMVSQGSENVDRIWQRLVSSQPAAQAAGPWREYRAGRLLSFMALVPAESGEALGGLPGMMAKNAAEKNPPLNALAVGVEPMPAKAGLNANLHLVSEDAGWRQSTASKITESIEGIKQDSQSFSPTLVEMISKVGVTEGKEAVDIDLLLTSQMLGNLGQVAREGVESLFGRAMSNGNGNGETEERVNHDPATYPGSDSVKLAPYIPSEHEAPPLFLEEPFAVDIQSISRKDDGLLELWLEGDVGFSGADDRNSPIGGELSLRVDSVKDFSGRELLRDERCLGYGDLGGRSRNRETETNTNHHNDHGWVWKHVRLEPGVAADRIARIEGKISFSAPTRVRRFEVPLKAGEAVEHAGMRFYLGGVKKNAVSYQVSGEAYRLLEVRARNKEGEVLYQEWKMGSPEDGRATQTYAGEVHSLEIYIAEEYIRSERDYLLQDIYAVPEKEEEEAYHWFAPQRVDPGYWQGLSGIDMGSLQRDPDQPRWDSGRKEVTPVASGTWAPVRMVVTHDPQKTWDHNPKVRLYAPVVPEFRGVLSALSYRVDEPAEKDGPEIHYVGVQYPYWTNTGEIAAGYHVDETPMAVQRFSLDTGLAEGQKLERLKGEVVFRFPTKTRSTMLDPKELWKGQTIDGVSVTLAEVSRGMFPGYGFKVEGTLEKLVNLHGISRDGERVAASPVNFQDAGYWTMTLPFDIEQVELVTAAEQKVFRYPFDFRAEYPKE